MIYGACPGPCDYTADPLCVHGWTRVLLPSFLPFATGVLLGLPRCACVLRMRVLDRLCFGTLRPAGARNSGDSITVILAGLRGLYSGPTDVTRPVTAPGEGNTLI